MRGQRGVPRLYRKTYVDRHGAKKQTATFFCDLWRHGRRQTHALGTSNKTEATARLRAILSANVTHGGPLRLSLMLDFVRQDYRQQGFKSAARLELSIRHLARVLGDPRVGDLDTGAIRDTGRASSTTCAGRASDP